MALYFAHNMFVTSDILKLLKH